MTATWPDWDRDRERPSHPAASAVFGEWIEEFLDRLQDLLHEFGRDVVRSDLAVSEVHADATPGDDMTWDLAAFMGRLLDGRASLSALPPEVLAELPHEQRHPRLAHLAPVPDDLAEYPEGVVTGRDGHRYRVVMPGARAHEHTVLRLDLVLAADAAPSNMEGAAS